MLDRCFRIHCVSDHLNLEVCLSQSQESGQYCVGYYKIDLFYVYQSLDVILTSTLSNIAIEDFSIARPRLYVEDAAWKAGYMLQH